MTRCVQPLVHPTGLFYVERLLASQQLGSAIAAMTGDLADRSGPDGWWRCAGETRVGGAGGLDGIKRRKGVVAAGDSTGI